MFFDFLKKLNRKNFTSSEKNLEELRYLRKEAGKYILKKKNKIKRKLFNFLTPK